MGSSKGTWGGARPGAGPKRKLEDAVMPNARMPRADPEATPFPWSYFALAYAFSWACWGIAAVFAVDAGPVEGGTEELLAAAPPGMLALVLLGVFGPFAAAFLLTWRREGRGGGRKAPKYGILFTHPYVQKAPKELRGKVARNVAAKLSLAAKIDYFSKEDRGEKLKKELDEQIKTLLEKKR